MTAKPTKKRIFFVALLAFAFTGTLVIPSFSNPAYAKETRHKKHKHHKKSSRAVYSTPHMSSLVIDVADGKVLEAESPDALRYPASLTKMMTLYLTFESLKKGTMTLNQQLPVSSHAASQPATNIALNPGQSIAVKDAILSLVVNSANDSAVVLGEAIGKTESEFAKKMTQKALALGMKNTVFQNASGLPNPRQHTTARDMATLGIALKRDFPQYFPFFKTESFTFAGNTYVTHNHVMMRYAGVDGIKTGFIRASGFNLVTSVNRDGHQLVAVVMGGNTWRSRDDKMIAMLDRTFNKLATLPGSNRVRLASEVKNHKVPVMFLDQETSAGVGEGDLQREK